MQLMPRKDRPEDPPEWTFLDLLKRGLVEYVDVNEENDCLVRITSCRPAEQRHVPMQVHHPACMRTAAPCKVSQSICMQMCRAHAVL